ncbi:MAG TPA: bifunctional oligoribonuclease/PAP phosphatase NrnA [Flavobacteriales bacterium]|nr:bifunctional oligoribonuclease/PAP phosphatase NrnA [Flavobacteriales bacterium]
MLFPSAPDRQVGELKALLDRPKRIAIVTHYNPDGDAMGSSLGLAHVLNGSGHHARVVLPNTPPAFLRWMPGFNGTLALDTNKEATLSAIAECELLFCLDFNQTDRTGGLEAAVKATSTKVLIDHHQDPGPFATITFSDTSACATSQMVFDILSAMGYDDRIGRDAATCLYTGIVTDSGSFRFSSTTPHTMSVAAALMERGIDVAGVHEAISDDNRLERLKLLGFTLSERLAVIPELDTAVISLSMADLARFDLQPGDTEGFVNYGLSIRGIRLAALFIERPELVKVSLRSKGELAVDRFLRDHFNGGGHRNAAGGHSKEPLTVALERFRSLLPALIASHPA